MPSQSELVHSHHLDLSDPSVLDGRRGLHATFFALRFSRLAGCTFTSLTGA